MIVNSSYKFKITDIEYNQSNLESACFLNYYDYEMTLKERVPYIWKGDQFFLTPENLEGTNALTLIYEYLLDELKDCVWLYDSSEGTLTNMPKIYKYVKDGVILKHFHDIDYKVELSVSVYPKREFVRGELQKVTWYLDTELTDKLLETTIVYTRDSLGFATGRTTTRQWYNVDDNKNSNSKITLKNYVINNLEQIDEGIRRRGNIVRGLQMPILGMMIATITGKTQEEIILMGRDFLKLYQLSFQSFTNESHQQIYTDMTDAQDYWLDNIIDAQGTTIRMYVLNELNVWGL